MPFRKAVPSWGVWVRDYLLYEAPNKEDYIFSMYKRYNEHLKAHNYKQISPDSFRGYVWLLVKLGGLEFVRAEPAHVTSESPDLADYLYSVDRPPAMHRGGVRHYYRVVSGTENAGFWHSPRLRWSELTGKPRG